MPDLSNPSLQLGKPWLVTGGAGFIGGHVIQMLTEARVPLVLLDIDANSADQKFADQVKFENCDIRDKKALTMVFAGQSFQGVIHLAALKSVEDSQKMKKEYFETNVTGTQNILEVMQEFDTRKIIFSSSAAVVEATWTTCKFFARASLLSIAFHHSDALLL